jgi:hypothetical protein
VMLGVFAVMPLLVARRWDSGGHSETFMQSVLGGIKNKQ